MLTDSQEDAIKTWLKKTIDEYYDKMMRYSEPAGGFLDGCRDGFKIARARISSESGRVDGTEDPIIFDMDEKLVARPFASISFRLRVKHADSGHVHFDVFVGRSKNLTHGKAGSLILGPEEFSEMKDRLGADMSPDSLPFP